MTHGDLNVNTYTEIIESKKVLEEAIGQTVNLFHLPGADFSFAPAARYLEESGFLAVFFADDRLNSYDPDLFALSRTLLYVIEGAPMCPLYDPFPRVYDPYHRLYEAVDTGGWVVDITHAVEPEPLALWKDTTPAVLEARFDCVRRVGNGQEWAAEPEEVVDYILVRRATSIDNIQLNNDYLRFQLEVKDIPATIKHREISARIQLRAPLAQIPAVLIDGKAEATIDSLIGDTLTFTWSAAPGQVVELHWNED
jgi:hypothetical protein